MCQEKRLEDMLVLGCSLAQMIVPARNASQREFPNLSAFRTSETGTRKRANDFLVLSAGSADTGKRVCLWGIREVSQIEQATVGGGCRPAC